MIMGMKLCKNIHRVIQRWQLILTPIVLFLLPIVARGAFGGDPGGLTNPLSVDSLRKFLDLILDVIVQIGWPLVVLAVIWTGFLFVKAQGKPAELDTAKQAFIWTVVGALIVLGAFAIGQFICGTVEEIGANIEC